mgnify:CR=1 FL=1
MDRPRGAVRPQRRSGPRDEEEVPGDRGRAGGGPRPIQPGGHRGGRSGGGVGFEEAVAHADLAARFFTAFEEALMYDFELEAGAEGILGHDRRGVAWRAARNGVYAADGHRSRGGRGVEEASRRGFACGSGAASYLGAAVPPSA